MIENEAMLKRLQQRQSNYDVQSWEVDRKNQIKQIKKICYYPPSISQSRTSRARQRTQNPKNQAAQ